MDFKQIQELIKIINKSHISELSIEEDKFKITIKQKDPEPTLVPSSAFPAAQPISYSTPIANSSPSGSNPEKSKPSSETKVENLIQIKSPMIGTFYRSSSPDKPSLVNIGEEVTSGQVVCIIEAMKLFNEIESEVSGKIVKCLVEDASPVEYDQPLFLVEP
ncbi:MAG: acetyl-CoA carboxylase biotin carboxyl carrier protein [Chitinophagaceae bacterium]